MKPRSGQQGLKEIASRRPDIILLDLGLPDMDGLEVLKRLREWSEAPVFVLSVRDDEQGKVAALDAGAEDYVTKPFQHAGIDWHVCALRNARHDRKKKCPFSKAAIWSSI